MSTSTARGKVRWWIRGRDEEPADTSLDAAVEPSDEASKDRSSAAKVRRVVVLRGSHTAEVSGSPVMETR